MANPSAGPVSLRIAGAQLPVTDDIEANVAAILRAVGIAAAQGADLLLTPEGSLSGYRPRFCRQTVEEALRVVTTAAAAAGLGLALGTCFVEEDGRCYNQVRLYSAEGEYLGFHSKTLTCGTLDEEPQGEIRDYAVAPLRTFQVKGVTLGALICNDLWANPGCTPQPDPHLTQQLARMGARVILHAVNGGRDGSALSELAWQYHEANLRMRAIAGGLHIVTVDNSDPDRWPCSAPCGVVGPDGEWIVKAEPRGEQHFCATLNL